jgi:hypothetical protein
MHISGDSLGDPQSMMRWVPSVAVMGSGLATEIPRWLKASRNKYSICAFVLRTSLAAKRTTDAQTAGLRRKGFSAPLRHGFFDLLDHHGFSETLGLTAFRPNVVPEAMAERTL